MKKILLIMLVLFVGITLAQTPIHTNKIQKANPKIYFDGKEELTLKPMKKADTEGKYSTPTLQAITSRTLGTLGNVFSILGNRTYLWADPQTNAVAMSHRYVVNTNNGYLTYDMSKDGGNTWSNDVISVYTPTNAASQYGARYPQGVIYNPSTNTTNNPDSTYFCYFAPTRDNSNPGQNSADWGGVAMGTHQLSGLMAPTQTDWSSNNQNGTTSTNGIYYFIPDAHIITKTGVIHNLDQMRLGSTLPTDYTYGDSLVYTRGTWNPTIKDFQYTAKNISIPVNEDYDGNKMIFDSKISFADDGQNGYISILGHGIAYGQNSLWERDSLIYIIVYKTTDGGNTWGQPIQIDLDPINNLVQTPGFSMTAWLEHDNVVDSLGNLHIIAAVGIAGVNASNPSGFSIINGWKDWGLFDIYTIDGGTQWKARLADYPQQFGMLYGTSNAASAPDPYVREYIRPQASRNWNGSKLFFTWFTTDSITNIGITPNDENSMPDMFSIGYNVVTGKWTAPKNITGNTTLATVIHFGSVSYYTLESNGRNTIPTVYANWNSPTATGQTLDLRYIHDAGFDNTEFTEESDASNLVDLNTLILSSNEITKNNLFSVSQNYPNPFDGGSTVDVNLVKSTTITLTITNTLGQVIKTETKNLPAGVHNLNLTSKGMQKGIYFYTISAEGNSTTKRMIIK
ncbi:MAG: T9SS type A sorting domain-containing protein [Bacteroidetes bacterium]|nr:T9SS type A sorting domain-containing protein [Bacteroidota bacterium]